MHLISLLGTATIKVVESKEWTRFFDPTDRVVECKMHLLISLFGTATKLSSRTSEQVFSTQQTELSSGNSFYYNPR